MSIGWSWDFTFHLKLCACFHQFAHKAWNRNQRPTFVYGMTDSSFDKIQRIIQFYTLWLLKAQWHPTCCSHFYSNPIWPDINANAFIQCGIFGSIWRFWFCLKYRAQPKQNGPNWISMVSRKHSKIHAKEAYYYVSHMFAQLKFTQANLINRSNAFDRLVLKNSINLLKAFVLRICRYHIHIKALQSGIFKKKKSNQHDVTKVFH